MDTTPTEAERQKAHEVWNEALCNSGIPGWSRTDAFAQALADQRAIYDARAMTLPSRCWDDNPSCNCANANPRPAAVAPELSADEQAIVDRFEAAVEPEEIRVERLVADRLREMDVPGLAKSFAAHVLRDAADAWPDAYASSVSDWLQDRADALDPS